MPRYIYFLLFLPFFWACQSEQAPLSEAPTLAEPDSLPLPAAAATDSLPIDSLIKDWYKKELGQGYSIRFPKKPRRLRNRSRSKIRYRLEAKTYSLQLTVADLKEEQSYADYQKDKERFYDLVIQDLIMDLDANSREANSINLRAENSFLYLDIYPAHNFRLEGADFQLSGRLIVIGRHLYSLAVVSFNGWTPDVQEVERLFMASLQKELYIE